MKTRDQIRAERASTLVGAIKPEQLEDYAAEVRSFAPLMLQNGLGPALAFLRSKAGGTKSALYEHLSSWVSETIFADAKGDLLTLIINHPAVQLMRAQDEALAFCTWLRRFAEARDPKARKS